MSHNLPLQITVYKDKESVFSSDYFSISDGFNALEEVKKVDEVVISSSVKSLEDIDNLVIVLTNLKNNFYASM